MTLNKKSLLLSNEVIVFPNFRETFEVGKLESLATIKNASLTNGEFIITPLLDVNEYGNEYSKVGTLVKIENISKPNEKGIIVVDVVGIKRVVIEQIIKGTEYHMALYSTFKEIGFRTKRTEELKGKLISLFENSIGELNLPIKKEDLKQFYETKPSQLSDAFSHIAISSFKIRYFLLNERSIEKRFEIILNEISKSVIRTGTTKAMHDVNQKVKEKFGSQQKEFYLKEQMKIIQEELDDLQGNENEIESLKKQVNSNPYPKQIKEKLLKEIKKLENTPSQAAEANVIRQYIETLIELPFWQRDEEIIDIQKAKKQLDKDHYGLKKVKERIIEYLAVKQNNKEAKGPILSLVGPPGTGKTTLAQSIAKSLNRKFIKISLGGIRDEAEIRGHRRTYIAAMPGKIITAMKRAKVINPVILLDEIDKMSSDFKGDPTSAMLEVLDYEQNKYFQDHYVEEDYDLSNVMFIATANYYNQIPEALIDRLEIIELSSYTELEKINIAKTHLIPEVIAETKITKTLFKWTDAAVKYIIQHYTIEAGVRQLRRTIEQIARKLIVQQLSKKEKVLTITPKLIKSLLGPEKFDYTKREKKPEIGTAMGLAWTQYGGDILPIEVVLFPGKGELVLTGQLKDVMRESAGIALSFVKANVKELGINPILDGKNIFSDYDIHVHSPDGATPKDGPSAGITFATALISTLTKKPISQFIGMTGEITLRGKVLPIGGLKEKSISAYRSGLKKILIPKENEKDLIELPKEVKDNLEIVSVEKYGDVFKQVFVS